MARKRGVEIKINGRGVKELLNSPEVRDDLLERGLNVESAARESAPYDTGEYADSIHVEQVTTDRAVVRVVADAPHAWVVEANTGNLAKALDAAGGS